ncbi:MAG: hypothetical protein ISS38_03150, partial [Candidatus Cloacimonetes bacterium]|nr:hypothetical protein [Candidatus Cloacimonadota bacterium]
MKDIKIYSLAFFLIIVVIFGCAKPNEPNINNILEIEQIYPTVGEARDVYVSDNFIYIAEDQGGFSIYDKNDNTLVCHYYGSIENARLISVVEEDSLLFVYDRYGSPATIMVFDISSIAEPEENAPITGQTADIEDMIAISDGSGGIDVFWTRPNEFLGGKYSEGGYVSSEPFQNSINGFDLDSENNYVYITGDQLGLYVCKYEFVYDGEFLISIIESILHIDTPGEALAVKVIDNYAFVSCKEEGFVTIDISDKENLIIVYQDDTSGWAQSIDAGGDYLV